jgi:hypothetical protein
MGSDFIYLFIFAVGLELKVFTLATPPAIFL